MMRIPKEGGMRNEECYISLIPCGVRCTWGKEG
jgi:hypothetical protein